MKNLKMNIVIGNIAVANSKSIEYLMSIRVFSLEILHYNNGNLVVKQF